MAAKIKQKSNKEAFKLLVIPFLSLYLMISLLNTNYYIISILMGTIFFTQSFILLHECGHQSFFRSKLLNQAFGYFFSIMVFIPFRNWREIHGLHHKWTGYRDKDPTTEKTFAALLDKRQKRVINFCWKYFIPVFTLGYRFGIYWNLEKLKRFLPKEAYIVCIFQMQIYLIIYLGIFIFIPTYLLSLLPALILSFVLCDILSMSQHSNIKMKYSGGEKVAPLKFSEQAKYSRSLRLPRIVSRYGLFNFNLHEAHHIYPGLPCYHLESVNVSSTNMYDFLSWLRYVKKIDGVDFIFNSSEDRSKF